MSSFLDEIFKRRIETKNLVAVKIKDKLYDLRDDFTSQEFSPIYSNSEEGLEVLRHDTAHILAEAIKEIYDKEAQITIGPNIQDGFYYDIYMPEKTISEKDFQLIEKTMKKIVKRNEKIERYIWNSKKAINFFREEGEEFKARIIEDLNQPEVSIYKQGSFYDLCRGPHSMSTGIAKAFKLTKISAAYWRGDQKNESLQRIYGTAWANDDDLQSYLIYMKKIKEIDHRNLGKKMGLFHMQDEAVGSIFWHPKGWKLYKIIEDYIRNKIQGTYSEVNTPQLIDRILWEKSGHWDHFRENMFTIKDENKVYALKPMNCPAHTQIFRQGIKSYKDLPLRLFEFGSCHRNEPSGSMHGIMRVRNFVQDDGHIFCMKEQIVEETKLFCNMLKEIYEDFGFNNFKVKLAGRPENSAGTNETWQEAEKYLSEGASSAGLVYKYNSGEGAFYGPKLEFVILDAMKREWQCGTLQLDFVMCERLNVTYVDSAGKKQFPIMIHRAILGSMQRFIGILLENYEGRLPFWLSPVQVTIAGVKESENISDYIKKIDDRLKQLNIRSYIDNRNESISYKLRDILFNQLIPCLVIVGEEEVSKENISFRIKNKNFTMDWNGFFNFISTNNEIKRNIYYNCNSKNNPQEG